MLGLASAGQRDSGAPAGGALRAQEHRQPGPSLRHQRPGSGPVLSAGAEGEGHHHRRTLRLRRHQGSLQEARPRAALGLALPHQGHSLEVQKGPEEVEPGGE